MGRFRLQKKTVLALSITNKNISHTYLISKVRIAPHRPGRDRIGEGANLFKLHTLYKTYQRVERTRLKKSLFIEARSDPR